MRRGAFAHHSTHLIHESTHAPSTNTGILPMQYLLTLRHSTHMMPSEVAQYIHSVEFKTHLEKLQNSDALRAHLTLHLLECIALDPLVEFRKESHFLRKINTTWFNIQLNRWSNFIDPFELRENSDLEQQIFAAIARNQQSDMYAAAKAQREHDKHIGEAMAHAEPLAREAAKNCQGNKHSFDLTQAEQDCVAAAYARVIEREMQPFHDRGRHLAETAAPKFVGKGWSEVVATFLFEHRDEMELLPA